MNEVVGVKREREMCERERVVTLRGCFPQVFWKWKLFPSLCGGARRHREGQGEGGVRG